MEKGSYELPIKYLAATSQNDLSEECANDVLERLDQRMLQDAAVVVGRPNLNIDYLQAFALQSLQKAREKGDETSWNRAKEAFAAYERGVRDFTGWAGMIPRGTLKIRKKGMKEIDNHVGHGQ